ncbi:MAG: 50S ribosomal protein L11 methyltransferase [Pseudomonadota bacterium]
MKWMAAVVIVEADPAEPAVEHISTLFTDLGLPGVVVEDPDMDPPEGWGDNALPKPDHHSVTGYFPQNDTLASNCLQLEQGLASLSQTQGISYQVHYREVDEEDWAESWKAYFWPEKLTDILVVKPTWREYTPAEGEMIIEIDPGMAFGTGTHPTTALCVQMIQDYLKPGDAFLDVGTGSGILMIAAARLGASRLFGTDADSVACDIARQNLLLNRTDPKNFCVKSGNLVDTVTETFQLISANILSEIILVLLDDVQKALVLDGILICSGIIEANQKLVVDKMEATGFQILEVRSKDGWVAIAGKLKPKTG